MDQWINGLIDLQIQKLIKYLSRLNLLRTLSSDKQTEEVEDHEGSDDQDGTANVSADDSLMDFEQELLNISMPDDADKPQPLAEIRVNSEDLVDRVSDVVVNKMQRELRRRSEANDAILTRIESKLDLILKQDPPNNKPGPSSTSSKETKVCYYCREQGHLANRCKERVKCIGCGSDQHPYERCVDKSSTCKKCDVVGHKNTVHETLDPALRKKLYDTHPTEFSHFFAVENAQNRLYRGTTKRRNSWEDRKGENSSRSNSKNSSRSREHSRDKHLKTDKVDKSVKGKKPRRTV